MEGLMLEMLELLQDVEAKMQRIHEIKAKMQALKPAKETKCKTITCTCGCTVACTSLTRHQKTKKHADLLAAKPITPKPVVETVKKVEVKAEVKPPIDDSDDEIDERDVIADEVIKNLKKHFYKGLYIENYPDQDLLDKNIRDDMYRIFIEHPNIKADQILKHHMETIYEGLDIHLDDHDFKDIAVEKDKFIDHICKNNRQVDTPLIYSLNNIKQFKQSLSKNLYYDYADMKNRGENDALLKDFLNKTAKELLAAHVSKYGYNENGIKEYLTLQQEC
jgi:hypothetical protein